MHEWRILSSIWRLFLNRRVRRPFSADSCPKIRKSLTTPKQIQLPERNHSRKRKEIQQETRLVMTILQLRLRRQWQELLLFSHLIFPGTSDFLHLKNNILTSSLSLYLSASETILVKKKKIVALSISEEKSNFVRVWKIAIKKHLSSPSALLWKAATTGDGILLL